MSIARSVPSHPAPSQERRSTCSFEIQYRSAPANGAERSRDSRSINIKPLAGLKNHRTYQVTSYELLGALH